MLVVFNPRIKKYEGFSDLMGLCEFLFVDNLTKDDPFVIMAALKSGPGCLVVSNDLFRTHGVALTSDDSKRLFTKWQRRHQVKHFNSSNPNPSHFLVSKASHFILLKVSCFHFCFCLQIPPKHPLVATKTGSHWHLPIKPGPVDAGQPELLVPKQWLCIKL